MIRKGEKLRFYECLTVLNLALVSVPLTGLLDPSLVSNYRYHGGTTGLLLISESSSQNATAAGGIRE